VGARTIAILRVSRRVVFAVGVTPCEVKRAKIIPEPNATTTNAPQKNVAPHTIVKIIFF
jgi:hypothetical protein